jgi:multimeric flavodoxin WrbA
MDNAHQRYSTSEALLQSALEQAGAKHALEFRLTKLRELNFRACEGYYSKSAYACTWPCSISQMHQHDGMQEVYENLVFWADVILVATPIRWGAASSLFYKMAERLNTVQNQITLRNRVMLKDKVAAFIITGGQDNIQAVAGQMLMFFGEIGFLFPQFPFIAHSRGWSAEDMENNVSFVRDSAELKQGAQGLVDRSIELARGLISEGKAAEQTERGGRKANPI